MKLENIDIVSLDLSTTSYKQKKSLIDLLSLTGVKISFILNKKSKLLIVDSKDNVDTYKCRMAFKLNIPVVHVDYFYKLLIEDNRSIKWQDFLIKDKTNEKKFKKGIVSIQMSNESGLKGFDCNKVKSYTIENDPNLKCFESSDYKILKWIVFHELNGNREFVFEIDSNTSTYRLRFETVKLCDRQIKTYYLSDSFQVYELFCHLTKPFLNESYRHDNRLPEKSGSKLLQNLYFKSLVNQSDLSQDLIDFLNYIWTESIGNLDDTFKHNEKIYGLTFDKLDKAELVLYKQREEFLKPQNERVNYSAEYFSCLPFKSDYHKNKSILIRKNLNDQFELIQVLRDMLNISEETNWSLRPSVKSIYRSIGSFVSRLNEDSRDYNCLKHKIKSSLELGQEINILNLYEINRPGEILNFNRKSLDNIQMLFHGSKASNMLGILSRGLLLPKNILSSDTPSGSDPLEMLGHGIYFSDSLTTSLKYTLNSKCKNTKFVLICEVALGKCKEMYEFDYDLINAPQGFDSVHGVKGSKFEDSEFCVYDPEQCRIKYLVEISEQDNQVYKFKSLLENNKTDECQQESIEDNINLEETSQKHQVNSELKTLDGKSLPLKSVHVRAKIIDMVSKVTIYQEYENTEENSIEAEYLFPLIDTATVCNFEAFINDKHIIGVCKEKEVARREYKEAIRQGKGAYLIDQETLEIFKVNVGNLPSKSKCVVKITYVSELDIQNEQILFKLPSNVCQWKLLEQREQLQDTVVSKFINKMGSIKKSSFKACVMMPFEIRSITSYTHEMKIKKTACQAVLEMGQKIPSFDDVDDTLVIAIEIATIHMPRMFVEDYTDDDNVTSRACMVSFYPEFDLGEHSLKPELPAINFVIDCSNSLKENNLILSSKKLILLMLQLLPKSCLFNITIFGSDYDQLFPYPQVNTCENVQKSRDFVFKRIVANRGNTDLLNFLQKESLFNSKTNYVLISDGHMTRPNELLRYLTSEKNRVFTCSIGNLTNNNHLLKLIASVTKSHYASYDVSSKSKWREKIQDLMDKIQQPPAISDIKIEWQNYQKPEADSFDYSYAPNKINCLFNGRRVVAYGFMPNCTQAVLKASINGLEFETLVSCSDLMITRGDLIHKLTAKALIDDWQNGILCQDDKIKNDFIRDKLKHKIIELSKKYSITSEYTSFIAIEDRDEDDTSKEQVQVNTLLDKEDIEIDVLAYMGYETSQFKTEDNEVDFDKLNENDRSLVFKFYSQNEDLLLSEKEKLFYADECKRRQMIKKAIEIYKTCEQSHEIELILNQLKNKQPFIFVKTLTGKTLTTDLSQIETVGDLKNAIQDKEGIPTDQQILIYAGRQMENHMFLSDYNLSEDACVHLVLRLRGGPGLSFESNKGDYSKPSVQNYIQYQDQCDVQVEEVEGDEVEGDEVEEGEGVEVEEGSEDEDLCMGHGFLDSPENKCESIEFALCSIDDNDDGDDLYKLSSRQPIEEVEMENQDEDKEEDQSLIIEDCAVFKSSSINIQLQPPPPPCPPPVASSFSFSSVASILNQNLVVEQQMRSESFLVTPSFLQASGLTELETCSFGGRSKTSSCGIFNSPRSGRFIGFSSNVPLSSVYVPTLNVSKKRESREYSRDQRVEILSDESLMHLEMKLIEKDKKQTKFEVKRLKAIDQNNVRDFINDHYLSKIKDISYDDLNKMNLNQFRTNLFLKFEIGFGNIFDIEPLIDHLMTMGLRSLGHQAEKKIKEMMVRLCLLAIIVKILTNSKFENFKQIKNYLLNQNQIQNFELKNLIQNFIQQVEVSQSKYPDVCDRLELSRNWDKLLTNWFF